MSDLKNTIISNSYFEEYEDRDTYDSEGFFKNLSTKFRYRGIKDIIIGFEENEENLNLVLTISIGDIFNIDPDYTLRESFLDDNNLTMAAISFIEKESGISIKINDFEDAGFLNCDMNDDESLFYANLK